MRLETISPRDPISAIREIIRYDHLPGDWSVELSPTSDDYRIRCVDPATFGKTSRYGIALLSRSDFMLPAMANDWSTVIANIREACANAYRAAFPPPPEYLFRPVRINRRSPKYLVRMEPKMANV